MAIIPFDFRPEKKAYFTHPSFQIHGQCTDFVDDFGATFDGYLSIDNVLFTAGSTVTFTWGTKTVVMTVSAVIVPADYGAKIDELPFNFHVSAAYNAELNADFDFAVVFSDAVTTIVYIVARNPGVDYNLDVISSTGACNWLSTSGVADVVLNNNITVLCDVFKADTAFSYDYKGTLKSALVFNGLYVDFQFNFELADYLHRLLKCENIEYNDYLANGLIVEANESCRNFKFGLRQSTGWIGSNSIDYYVVLRGGITKRDYIANFTDYWTYYPDASIWRLLNHVKFYTDMFHSATKNQKLFSSFYINEPEPFGAFDVYIDITDVAGATGSYRLLNRQNYEAQHKYTLQYSFNDMDIQAISTAGLGLGTVKSWEIRLFRPGTLENFTIDQRTLVANDYRENFFVFENSLGGFQTIKTLGEHEHGVEIDKEEFEKTIPVLSLLNENFMVSETYGHLFKGQIFSGWLNIEDIYNFLDFLNSENIWKQNEHHEAMVPIKILKGNWALEKKSNNGVHQYGFNLQYVQTVRDKHVTDLIPL